MREKAWREKFRKTPNALHDANGQVLELVGVQGLDFLRLGRELPGSALAVQPITATYLFRNFLFDAEPLKPPLAFAGMIVPWIRKDKDDSYREIGTTPFRIEGLELVK